MHRGAPSVSARSTLTSNGSSTNDPFAGRQPLPTCTLNSQEVHNLLQWLTKCQVVTQNGSNTNCSLSAWLVTHSQVTKPLSLTRASEREPDTQA